MKLGIMQGRLVPPEPERFQSFPRARWRDEFALAAAAGLETIEWIFDAYGEDMNPLVTEAGRREMERLSAAHHITVESVCADWFMDHPLIGAGELQARWAKLGWLLEQCASMRVNRIVVPFVDASAIRNGADADTVAEGFRKLTSVIERRGIELHLETALAPAEFASLLARLPHPGIKVNYDSGNSASLGYRPQDEFAAYGERVGSVHLKDRRRGGATVPLGTGDTDFGSLFEVLQRVRYAGDFILQAARGEPGGELQWTRGNAAAARGMMRRLEAA
jgi:L-ribulose-5-phosphate 3-epimerase